MNEHDDLTGLADVLGPLRGPATPTELANEHATVERMVAVHRAAQGRFVFGSRRSKVATLVAAGVLGFGGMAAASPSMLGTPAPVPMVIGPDQPAEPDVDAPADEQPPAPDEVPADVAIVEVPVLDDPVADEPVAATPAAEVPALVDDLTTAFDERTCRPGDHGQTVSAVARGEFPEGVSVADAAKSSCGKDHEGAAKPPKVVVNPPVEAKPSKVVVKPPVEAKPSKVVVKPPVEAKPPKVVVKPPVEKPPVEKPPVVEAPPSAPAPEVPIEQPGAGDTSPDGTGDTSPDGTNDTGPTDPQGG